MGKISCQECKKTCKGQAVRLQDKYYHAKCFKCKECKKQLAAGGFYAKEDSYYCAEDYQRLFGTKCAACNKYVEGEVVTALGNTYHQNCFHCTKCGEKFGAGDKVTFNGKDYLCNKCLEKEEDASSPTKKGTGKGKGAPVTSTPAKPPHPDMVDGRTPSQNGDGADNPFRVMLYQEEGPYNGPLSPISLNSQDSFSPRRMDQSGSSYDYDNDSIHLLPPNDSQKGGRLSPIQQIMKYRSPSPNSTMSRSSRKSRDSSGSYETRFDVDYGRFYKTSYLKGPKEPLPYKRGPSWNPNVKPTSPHFHRPDNFSYSQVRTDFIIPMKKENSSFESQYMTKRKMESIVAMNNEEAIKLSRFPDATRHEQYRPPAIERDDWPAPPAPAAAFPELFRAHQAGKGKAAEDEEDGQVEAPLDPKVAKEIEELAKMESGVGKVILKDFQKKRNKGSPALDPRSASRTPSAKTEPHYKTRYESPIFASPSRDLDYRPRLHSMDDEILEYKKYRTSTLPISNFPAPKPGYGLQQKSATLPGDSATNGGYFEGYDDERQPRRPAESGDEGGSHSELERRSYYTSNSSMEEYDPETGLRRSRWRYSSHYGSFNKPSYLQFRRSMPSMLRAEEPPQIYPYEQLKISNFQLPPGCDRNTLEVHLARDEFESIFHLSREQFYRMAEWKRNDLKKRVGLF